MLVCGKATGLILQKTYLCRVSAMSKRSQNSDGRSSSSNTKRRRTDEKLEKKMARDATEDAEFVGGSSVPRRPGQTKSYPKEIDPKTNKEQDPSEIKFTAKLPIRNHKGQLVFEGVPDFYPNMTPKEVLQAGSFGGTYFRPIKSGVTGKSYSGVWKELPKDWLEGLNIGRQVRFYQGRRTADDNRQIGRWLRCAGTTGRWRNNLISKCVRSSSSFDNHTISPVVRQTLQHWGYRLTKEDYEVYAKQMKRKGLA